MALRFRRADKNIKVQYLILFAQLTPCRAGGGGDCWLFAVCDDVVAAFNYVSCKSSNERAPLKPMDDAINLCIRCAMHKCIYVKSVSPHMLKATNEYPFLVLDVDVDANARTTMHVHG